MKATLPSFGEFIALLAMLSSLTALSIDAMLPAFGQIGHDLGTLHDNQTQLIVSTLFLGIGSGQLFIGPLSDALGRKPLMYLGLGLFMFGSVLAMLAQDFNHILLGRFLQGLGASAPRVLTAALVRDCYSGNGMARVMSFTMTVFVFVPILAPSVGQVILLVANWRYIFALFLLLALIVLLWFKLRMPETLSPDKRRPFTLTYIRDGLLTVLTHRTTMIYTVAAGLTFGAFLGYLNSAQQILQEQYALGNQFALYFALLALGIGSASFINGRAVMHYGMYRITQTASISMAVLAGVLWIIAWQTNGHPPLPIFLSFMGMIFLCLGLQFGNINALAMEPLGHMAGMAASVIGSLSTLISIPLGTFIGQQYHHSVIPLVSGFFAAGLIVSLLIRWGRPRPTIQP